MPSIQVSLVIETEKKAAQIELDARRKAQEILDAAAVTSYDIHQNNNKAIDDKIQVLFSAAREQAESIRQAEEASCAEMILSLQSTAGDNKNTAIQAAVSLLTGRT